MPINWDDYVKGVSAKEPAPSQSGVNWNDYVNPPPAVKGGFISDIKRGTGQVVEAVGSTLQDVGADEVGQAIEGYGRGVVRRNPSEINTFGEALSKPLTTAREAVGELVPQIGSSLATGLAGRVVGGVLGLPFGPAGVAAGQTLGAAGGAYLGNLVQEYGGIRTEQREQGIEDKTRALGAAGAAAVLDTAFGAERIANKFLKEGSDILARQPGSSLLKQVGKQGAIGFGIESVTEGAQTGLERYGAYKPLTGEEAYNEYGLAMLKGGIGGGVVRGGLAAVAGEQTPPGGSLLQGGNKTQDTNAIQQAFDQPQTSGMPTTNIVPPPPAPPITPSADTTPPPAPIVSGGTTPIAQANQQAQVENQQVQAALDAQTKRENVFQSIGAVYTPELLDGTLSIFGQTIIGPQVNTFGDALASKIAALPPQAVTIANAIAQANRTLATDNNSSPVISFTYSGNNPLGSAKAVVTALEKITNKFQIGHVQSVDEAAAILNLLSKSAKSTQLDQINAIHAALTGQDTEGYIASQTSKPKGKSNAQQQQQQQQQVSSGLGTVPVQGGTIQGDGGLTGLLQPGAVQSVGTGVVSGAANDQQAGQLPGEGIRTGPSVAPADDLGGAAQAPQDVSGAPSEQAVASNAQNANRVQPSTASEETRGTRVLGVSTQGATNALAEEKVTPGRTAWGDMDATGTSFDDLPENLQQDWERAVAEGIATGDLQETLAVSAQDAVLSKTVRTVIRAALDMVIQPTSRMSEDVAARKRDFVAAYWGGARAETLNEVAVALGISKDQAKRWSAELPNFLTVNGQKIKTAIEFAAKERGVDLDDVRNNLRKLEEQNTTEAMVDEIEGTGQSTSATEEPLSSDQEDVEVNAEEFGKAPEEDLNTAEADAGQNDFVISSRKSASLQEQNNAVETNQAKIMRLLDMQDKINEAESIENPPAPKIVSLSEAALEKLGGDVTKLKEHDLLNLAVNAKLTENFELADQLNAELSSRIEKALEKAQKQADQKTQKGTTNAVQEPSTEKVSVPEGAAGGEGVGKGNAKVGKATRVRKAKIEKPVETKVEEVTPAVLTPKEQWDALKQQFPGMPPYGVLTKPEKETWDDFANRGFGDIGSVATVLGGADKIAKAFEAVTETAAPAAEPVVEPAAEPVAEAAAPVEETVQEQVTEEVLAPQLEALPEAQVQRLETHYGEKRGSASFLAKVKEDVVLYATKGAQAVAGAIRDIIKAIHAGVLSVAMVFNPTMVTKPEAFVFTPQTQTYQQEVKAELPKGTENMSQAGKDAYQYIYPAIKDKLIEANKFFVLADKPNGRTYVFNPDGSLLLERKTLYGAAAGDLLTGDNNLPKNRVTPAGLFNLGLRDAARGGGEAVTAGEYDFGKVFVLDKAYGGEFSGTIMHSVWTKEKDAAQRLAALKNEKPGDFRYSFGCINVDKETYKNLITNHLSQMDGAKLFIVPDDQTKVKDYITGNVKGDELDRLGITPKTEQITVPVGGAKQTAGVERTTVGREEPGILASRGTFLDFEDVETQLSGVDLVREQLREAGIENALDFVSDWTLERDTSKNAWHGSLEVVGGRYVGSLNTAKLNNPKYAALVARHEISHAVDMAPHGGIYSAQPEMGVAVQNGQVVPTGAVAREMFALYQTDKDWKDFLAYPFDIKEYPDLNNGTKIQIELFAQIMAVYTSPAGRAYIEAAAPKTAAYLKEVVNDIKSSKPLQIQKERVAALRTISFQNRNQPSRNQTTGGLPPKGRGREEIGPLAAKGTAATVDAAVNLLPPKLRSPVKSTTTNLLYQAKQGVLASAITEDVINMASKFMKSAKTYLAAQYARQATRLNHELKIDKILTQFDKLPKNLQGTGEGSVNKYIYDSTREGKWGYIPVERMVGTTLLTEDPDMKARYLAFPPEAQKLIRDVFEQGYDALDAKQNAIRDAIDREYADRLKAVEGDEELTDKLNKEKKLALSREKKLIGLDNSKPYAYLGRYGDFVVVAKSAEYKAKEDLSRSKDISKAEQERYIAWMAENRSNPAHYVVQFAETLGDADAIAEQLKATGNYDMPESFEKELYANEGADLFLAVARLRTLFDKQSEGANPAAQAAINNLLGDLYLHTVSEASSRKSEFQRLNISGADQDMMRNLATRGRADAHFLAALEHNDAISDAITAMREERNRNRKEASPYFNELLLRHANSMKYETPGVLTNALLRMSNVWYLATNPAFYLQQILQTGVLSLPYMSGRLGYFRSARAVKKAYGDMATLVKGLGVGDHIDFTKAPADVRDMLNKLVGMGKIDIGIDTDARVRAGETGIAAKVMQKLQGVNNRIEAVNRATAAIAAYRGYLDRYKNGDTAAATAYAADVVSNTHGSYDAFNTPRLMQGGAGKVLLQFKRFQIIQISMLLKLINTAFKGASREEKTVARRALGFIAGHMMVLGGALAVPFVQQFGSLLLKAFGDDDEPENLELTLRRLINDPVMADLLVNGVPGALGVNLGSKLGMGNVFSILPFTDIDFTSRAGAEKMLVGIMGPSAGLGLKFADGLGQMASGEYYKGLESMLPSGVANVMKAGRFATEGVTMRNGDVVLKPEEISMFDAAFQAVGLPTTTITDRQFTQRVVAEFDKFYDKRTTEIKGDYVNASRDGDVNSMADAREEWSKLQESRVKNGYKRQPLSDLFRAPSAAAKRERNIAGGVEFSKSNRRFVESLSTL